MTSIFEYPKQELQLDLVAHGFKKYLAEQIFDWIYVKNIYSFDEMTNISKPDRIKLQEHYTIEPLKIAVQQQSKDGTVKFLFELADGYKIETVLMPQSYGNSVCVTTQVGCNMACTFCASGLLKKTRNLSTAEIVQQVMMVNRYLATTGERVSHIVVMGIGEPLDNFENVINFVNIINDSKGYQIGARHITISTCGLIPKIRQFADLKTQVNLAISLHAPNNTIRNQLMPINKAYPVEKLMDVVRYYIEQTNRRVTFEYILIEDVNDSREVALELAKLIRGLNAYVNLIPYNTVAENGYQRSTKINQFFETLQQQKINCIVRREFGHDIDAACGQLRAKNEGIIRK
ncbi:23S rRNA (adenine2503-C2)-methyltransferase [Spiroplasma sp. NBRC 100390]|uniref:23S rRNA (adenine(2503)-C(2))-methyltransferase RlmN n=1 Tax=unclassified Spiroplasma TaxID=2637901 RepID=UPI00089285AB|nr:MULTISPECIES: 23S rRNA (adenine(2503)-C(2))-methyltransferase RlmN [unclassified Spiroplasma]AOX44194.1 23S rRNA (adenine2503-C2)-methyltransferase [Spiroplasma sp. TU-14]APE13664.1 23S rRNA (adenine2503-C2)-methyltransferase [Spiroplasma sp. NBRC 100390]